MTTTPTGTLRTLDIGGSHVSSAVVEIGDGSATIVRRGERNLDSSSSRESILRQIAGAASDLGQAGPSPRWGVAIPGPFDYEAGSGDFEGVGKFQSIAGVDLRAEFAREFGVAHDDIRFVNDAEGYAIGEWAFGAGRHEPRLVCITLGTGVGSAFLDAGTPVLEHPGIPGDGSVHLLTRDGLPLEHYMSTAAILRDWRERGGAGGTVRDIAELARSGDAQAHAAFSGAIRILGEVVADSVASFGATALLVGGSISRSWDLIEAPLGAGLASVRPELAELPLLRSALLDDAPLFGAADWASR